MASDSDVLRLAAARLKSEHGLNETQHDRFMLAVADLLDRLADCHDEPDCYDVRGLCPEARSALALACAYLGAES
jgi:hypothetical protein